MITHRQATVRVLAKIAAYDPTAPAASDAVEAAWTEHFYETGWFRQNEPGPRQEAVEDLLAGVARFYRDHDGSRPLLPKLITDAALSVRRDRNKHLSSGDPRYTARGDMLAAPDEDPQLELESAQQAAARRQSITEYARRFGISERQAEARIHVREATTRAHDAYGDLAAAHANYAQALVAHQRAAAPPAPMPTDEDTHDDDAAEDRIPGDPAGGTS